jgi:hypothetical protein
VLPCGPAARRIGSVVHIYPELGQKRGLEIYLERFSLHVGVRQNVTIEGAQEHSVEIFD